MIFYKIVIMRDRREMSKMYNCVAMESFMSILLMRVVYGFGCYYD
jgi:hypothetical protein